MPDVEGAPVTDGLYANAVTTLRSWTATSLKADEARRRTLKLLLEDGPLTVDRTHRAGHLTASTMVLDPTGRMLLCLHRRLNLWMQVGGHCEPTDTSLAAAALREAIEESGVAGLVLVPDPIDVDVHPTSCRPADGEPATATLHFDVRFAALAPAGAVEQLSEESRALGWFTADELPAPLANGVRSQIAPAFAVPGAPSNPGAVQG